SLGGVPPSVTATCSMAAQPTSAATTRRARAHKRCRTPASRRSTAVDSPAPDPARVGSGAPSLRSNPGRAWPASPGPRPHEAGDRRTVDRLGIGRVDDQVRDVEVQRIVVAGGDRLLQLVHLLRFVVVVAGMAIAILRPLDEPPLALL